MKGGWGRSRPPAWNQGHAQQPGRWPTLHGEPGSSRTRGTADFTRERVDFTRERVWLLLWGAVSCPHPVSPSLWSRLLL